MPSNQVESIGVPDEVKHAAQAEIIERLRGIAAAHENDADFQLKICHPLAAKQIRDQARILNEAADLLEAGESREEYRVGANGRWGPPVPAEGVERSRWNWEEWHSRDDIRIQRHEVTETPWVDVEAGEFREPEEDLYREAGE